MAVKLPLKNIEVRCSEKSHCQLNNHSQAWTIFLNGHANGHAARCTCTGQLCFDYDKRQLYSNSCFRQTM